MRRWDWTPVWAAVLHTCPCADLSKRAHGGDGRALVGGQSLFPHVDSVRTTGFPWACWVPRRAPRHPGSSPQKAPVRRESHCKRNWETGREEAAVWTGTSSPSGMCRGSLSGPLRCARPFSLPAKKPTLDICRSRALMANWWEPAMTEGHSSN